MEFEEAHNNLRAMRLLYRLLEDDSLGLQNEYSELVERARVLLKNMLDVAAEKVLETYLKVIATQSGIGKASCTSEPEKSMASQQLSHLVGAGSTQISVKCPTYSKVPSEQSQFSLLAKQAVSGPSKSSIAVNRETNRKRLRSLGEESSAVWPNKDTNHHQRQLKNINTFHGADESKEANEVTCLDRTCQIQGNSNAANWVEPLDGEGDFSKDISNSVKRLESRILAMQLCSNMVDSTKNMVSRHSINKLADNPVIQRKKGVERSQLGSGWPLLEENGLRNQHTRELTSKDKNLTSANEFRDLLVLTGNRSSSQPANQKNKLHSPTLPVKSINMSRQIGTHKGGFSKVTQLVEGGEELPNQNRIQTTAQNMTMMDRVKLLDRSLSGNDHLVSQASECIQGLMVPLIQDDLTRTPSMISGQTTRGNLVRKSPMAQTETERKIMRPEPTKAAELMGSTMSIITGKEKKLQRQKVMRPRPTPSEVKPPSQREWRVAERGRSHEVSHVDPHRRRILPGHGELEESDSSSQSYDSWTTWTSSASSSCSNSEDDSLSGETPAQRYVGPTSKRMVDVAYEGSSEESSLSYPSKDMRTSPRVGSLKSVKSHRFHHKRQPEKAIGRLRRLKNKLGFIFHHHHHHHHHHDHDDGDHRHSMWNNLRKTFHGRNKHEGKSKGRVEKTRSVVARVPRKNQVGHFHGLVEGLLRHVRHSKKPKTSKVGRIQGSTNAPHGQGKKLHWWQMLRHRRRVKLNNGGRVKMSSKSQKLHKNCRST
ncbi:hypothetical protein L6164_032581 [Bauhinia variegata]|uniref:Uncharacterized protein n=1 Tax=Bauhinia variegata TaxID=167791 RepID=A0ACB9KPT6_BAUVA|nr:hypothetical protein L6164_032581 [Bauhinia variegata]